MPASNEQLITEFVTAREKATYWEKARAKRREVLLFRMGIKRRLLSRTGVVLRKRMKRTHASVKTIRNLIALGRLKAEDIAPALSTTEFDQGIAHGTPDSLPWEAEGDVIDGV